MVHGVARASLGGDYTNQERPMTCVSVYLLYHHCRTQKYWLSLDLVRKAGLGVLVSLLPCTFRGWVLALIAWRGSGLIILTSTRPIIAEHNPCQLQIVHTGGHLCGLPLAVLPPCHIIHQSPGPGTWQCDFLDLICDCFPISAIYSGLSLLMYQPEEEGM